ncbi:MAG: nuclear transport factor 2 family protein [Acidimicrobiales bacterium]|nr:nuclear transport factor 2 family protein [Acidimicrobiales bacterium]
MTDTNARLVAEKYLDAASKGDTDAIGQLYATDAEFLPGTSGSTAIHGRDAIAAHYNAHVRSVHPHFDELFWAVDGNNVFVEIVASAPGRQEKTYIIDLFTMTADGHIARMAAYTRQSRDERRPLPSLDAESWRNMGSMSRSVAERYLQAASSGDTATIADLYDRDAVFLPIPPNTQIIQGLDDVRKHYANHVASVHPHYVDLSWTVDGLNVIVEIEAEVPGQEDHTHVVDVFTMTEHGKIARMAAYRRDRR